jgi:hypothetical protein
MCRCGHELERHTHLHDGMYCGTCTCDRYRPPRKHRWLWW